MQVNYVGNEGAGSTLWTSFLGIYSTRACNWPIVIRHFCDMQENR